MKRLHFSSFRQRLNAAFLAVSLVPMLLCSGLLLQIFRLRMTSNAQQTAQQQLSASCEALDTLHTRTPVPAQAASYKRPQLVGSDRISGAVCVE